MLVALYFIALTYIIVRKLKRETVYGTSLLDEDHSLHLFSLRMFTCGIYYDFLEWLAGKQQYEFLAGLMCCGSAIILTIEISMFVLIKQLWDRHNHDSTDSGIFWFGAFVVTEGV